LGARREEKRKKFQKGLSHRGIDDMKNSRKAVAVMNNATSSVKNSSELREGRIVTKLSLEGERWQINTSYRIIRYSELHLPGEGGEAAE
jgi:predicted RNA-binding protein with PUA domain